MTAQQVVELFDDQLAAYKHPRDVVFLDALPRNQTGKVDRLLLRKIVAERPGDALASSPARWLRRRHPTAAPVPPTTE
jgi:acyl-coenzyme A synthetase/AMP-(fatty) acid ligase